MFPSHSLFHLQSSICPNCSLTAHQDHQVANLMHSLCSSNFSCLSNSQRSRPTTSSLEIFSGFLQPTISWFSPNLLASFSHFSQQIAFLDLPNHCLSELIDSSGINYYFYGDSQIYIFTTDLLNFRTFPTLFLVVKKTFIQTQHSEFSHFYKQLLPSKYFLMREARNHPVH